VEVGRGQWRAAEVADVRGWARPARHRRPGEAGSSVAPGEAGGAGPHRWRWLVDGEGSLVEAGGGGVGGTSGRWWHRPQGSGAGPPGSSGTMTWVTSVWAAAVAAVSRARDK
jgi:hypothetical protein